MAQPSNLDKMMMMMWWWLWWLLWYDVMMMMMIMATLHNGATIQSWGHDCEIMMTQILRIFFVDEDFCWETLNLNNYVNHIWDLIITRLSNCPVFCFVVATIKFRIQTTMNINTNVNSFTSQHIYKVQLRLQIQNTNTADSITSNACFLHPWQSDITNYCEYL